MGGGGKGGGSGDSETTIRFAPYIEEVHSDFLTRIQTLVNTMAAAEPSAYGLDNDDFCAALDTSFFTAGYTIASFPSMFDMYGKFLAGLDVETLFDQLLSHDVEAAAIGNRVAAYSQELDDDIEENGWPRIAAGMRDINCVTSSNFAIAQTLLEAKKAKLLTTYDADLRTKMIGVAAQRWITHLDWNKAVIGTYAEIFKLYYALKMDVDNQDQTRKVKYALWPFTIYEYERLALGALQGAVNQNKSVEGAEPSTAMKVLGGAASGAAIGSSILPGWGTAIGAVAGGIAGLFM